MYVRACACVHVCAHALCEQALTHCDCVLIFSLCVLLAYDLCPQHFLSVGQLLSHFTSPQQCSVNNKSTSPNMQSTHTYILLFGSKFHIILAIYVQMLDIYRKNSNIIRTIFTKNRGIVAGVRITHVN